MNHFGCILASGISAFFNASGALLARSHAMRGRRFLNGVLKCTFPNQSNSCRPSTPPVPISILALFSVYFLFITCSVSRLSRMRIRSIPTTTADIWSVRVNHPFVPAFPPCFLPPPRRRAGLFIILRRPVHDQPWQVLLFIPGDCFRLSAFSFLLLLQDSALL